MKYLSIVRANTLAVTSRQSELHDAFTEPVTFVDQEGEKMGDHIQVMRTWLGSLDTDKHDQVYVQQRAQLANAAKYGDWDEVLDVLESGRKNYRESWVNAPRISEQLYHTTPSVRTAGEDMRIHR